MKKRYMWKSWVAILVGMLLIFSSCSENGEVFSQEQEAPEGYVSVEFKAQIPDMNPVQTRAVDPDGLDVHNMKLFCFNTYGLFITIAYATEVSVTNDGHTGTFKADIPSETTIIHFVANQNEGQYDMSSFAGKSEAEVLAVMEGGSGMMIYWARFKQNPNSTYAGGDNAGEVKNIKDQLSDASQGDDYAITLLRNQAKVSIGTSAVNAEKVTSFENGWENEHFTVTGFRTANIHAFGTVAPYPSGGFDSFSFPHSFVTLPEDKAMMSDIEDINTKQDDYIFEHENTLDNPVSVIIKGYNSGESVNDAKYYRVLLQDDSGNLLPVLRNHHYQINIEGPLKFGQSTFEEALAAPATNNAWIAVDEWVNAISDGSNSLEVEETHVVLASSHAGFTYPLKYKASAQPTISWLDGNNVAKQNPVSNSYDSATGEGTYCCRCMNLLISSRVHCSCSWVRCTVRLMLL